MLGVEAHGYRYLIQSIGRCLASTASSATVPEIVNGGIPTSYERAKPFTSIPGPRGLPFVGSLLDYRFGKYSLNQCHQVIIDRFRRYGPLVREKILGIDLIRVFDPEDVKTIFQSESKTPSITPLQEAVQMYRKIRNLSLGLGNLNGEEWYRLRSAVQQAMMRPQAVVAYLPLVEQVASDFVDTIRQRRQADSLVVPDFKKLVSKWSLESSGNLVFEKRLGSFNGGVSEQWASDLIDANSDMFELAGIMKFSLPLHRWITTPKWKRLVQVEDYVYGETRKLVQETVDKVSQSKEQLDDRTFNFMAYLISRKELSMEDVFILAFSLFGDGLNTTSPMLIYNLYNLATNPECQERLYNEICQHVPNNGTIDASVLTRMPYLKACVKETFRLFPIGSEISRVPDKNLVLSGYQVPAGTHCDINVSLLLRSDVNFKKANSFLPERWLREGRGNVESAEKSHPYLVLPFGHGPRTCAGRRFAEQDLYVMLSRLVKNFKIDYRYGEIGQYYSSLLLPDGNAQFRFEDRL